MNYIYIIECKDGTLYTGWTKDLTKRINAHNQGKGCKYTRSRFPVNLKYYEVFSSKSDALKREYEIKRLTRKEKLSLIKGEI